MKFRKAYDPQVHVTVDTGEGITKQNHRTETNVNLIMAKYQKTGVIAHRNEFEPRYDDATDLDFQAAMNLVVSSQQMFSELPSTLRKKFGNDPANFLAFVNDPLNQDEMIELGLATDNRPVEPIPVPVTLTNPPDTTSEPA